MNTMMKYMTNNDECEQGGVAKYLELRQKLKENIREKLNKESGDCCGQEKRQKLLPFDNYGSFFGPSQTVIAPRVIQESKSLWNSSASTTIGSKPGGVHDRPIPLKTNDRKRQLQTRREARDYSFLLSDDAELPVPSPKSSVLTSASESNSTPVVVSGKQEGSSNGVGPGLPSKPTLSTCDSVLERKPPVSMGKKASAPSVEKKVSMAGVKNILPASCKPPSSKMESPLPKQSLEPRKPMSKQPVVSSKPQMKKAAKPISSHAMSQVDRPRKRPPIRDDDAEEEAEEALNIIRKMFNTQRYAHVRVDDDRNMEMSFKQIMAEEKRTARIARKEDAEQLRLIEEEQRQEKLAKKKRQMSHH